MQVLVFVIAGLSSIARFGVYAETLDENFTADDFLNHGISDSGERIYYETTVIPGWTDSDPASGDGSEDSYSDLLIPQPIVSGPVFGYSSSELNASTIQEMKRKRHQKRDGTATKGLDFQMQKLLLEMHNIYRGKVSPPASDMSYLEWDDELARLAQIWSDECSFTHFVPVSEKYSNKTPVGQNLYEGDDPTGLLGLQMWFDEYIHYDLRKKECEPGRECGHFVQMAWAETNKLGCAKTQCGAMRYMFVCHYFPQALRQTQMYEVGKPCSNCPGSLCMNNLCMTPEQCKNNPADCQYAKCDLECHNCGRLNKENCTCECMHGWDAPDCSHACEDKHMRCNKSPGWPNRAACSMNNRLVGNKFCRKMCGKCSVIDNTTAPNVTCCGGETCDRGFVLEKDCECKLLCPGPLCDSEEFGLYQPLGLDKAQAVVGDSAKTVPATALWILELALLHKLRKLWENI